MDWNRISGLWSEYQGMAKANWGRLTDNDMTAISGSRDLLIGKLQTRYGITADQAEQQVDNWIASLAVQAAKPLLSAAAILPGLRTLQPAPSPPRPTNPFVRTQHWSLA